MCVCREFQQICDWLKISPEQKSQLKQQQQTILAAKHTFKRLIHKLLANKQEFMQELQQFEKTTDSLQVLFTPEQTAKYLIFVERVSHSICETD